MHSIRKWIASKISTYRHSDDSSDDALERANTSGAFASGFFNANTAATFFAPVSSSTSARKKDHAQLLADISRGAQTILQFYYSDDELNLIASELESFDGRRDPVRCTELVRQLRYAQDKVMQLFFQLMDEWKCDRASRDYRQKFPEDLLNDNENGETFNGQIWFSAECLASGSDIMDHEEESNMLRPLAKVLTNHLDQIRILLRQSSSDVQNKVAFYLDLIARMEHFDRLFTAFEFEYVKAMLPIKSIDDIEKQQELTVLFSEALERALKRQLIRQSHVDECNPSVMISLPRLAIVHGLIYCGNESAICKRHKHQLPSVLKAYHSLLHRIRHMLTSLSGAQVLLLERMLANEENADNVDFSQFDKNTNRPDLPTTILKNVDSFESNVVALADTRNEIEQTHQEQDQIKEKEDDDHVHNEKQNESLDEHRDCDEVDISFWRHKKYKLKKSQSNELLVKTSSPDQIQHFTNEPTSSSSTSVRTRQYDSYRPTETTPTPTTPAQSTHSTHVQTNATLVERSSSYIDRAYEDGDHFADDEDSDDYEDEEVVVSSTDSTDEEEDDDDDDEEEDEEGNENEEEELESDHINRNQNSLLATSSNVNCHHHPSESSCSKKVLQSSDLPAVVSKQLLHKLFVSIASIADQLQSNYASDLRIILKTVFELHTLDAHDEIDSVSVEEAEEATEQLSNRFATSLSSSQQRENLPSTLNEPNDYSELLANNEHMQLLFTTTLNALENIQPTVRCDQPSDSSSANESQTRFRRDNDDERSSTQPNHIHNSSSSNALAAPQSTIDSNANESNTSGRSTGRLFDPEERQLGSNIPPMWVPDELVSECSGCNIQFTLLRRRHHCRNCGFIFCNNCSNHFVQLAHFGYMKPVRVCNECYES